jgi:hypothetical protein
MGPIALTAVGALNGKDTEIVKGEYLTIGGNTFEILIL